MYTFTISARDLFFSDYEVKKVEMTFKNNEGVEDQYLIETVEIEGLTGIAPYADLFAFQNISDLDCLKLFAICEENNWNYDVLQS